MISATIQASPMKLCTFIVLRKAYQNTKRKFRNLAYDVTMTSLLKQWENLDFRKTRKIGYRLKGNDESFPKMYFLLKLSDRIKSYDHLNGILAYFSRFYHDLSLIILQSRDHDCQF